MKREHGAVLIGKPERTKAATAPATVSGEQCRNTTGRKAGKVGKAMTRKSGDLPSNQNRNSGGVSGQVVSTLSHLIHAPRPKRGGRKMIWKTKTHQFTATVCQKTGKPCPALAQMARAVVQAMEAAVPATTPDFEVEGSSELAYCAQGCMARFRAQKDLIRLFCGTSTDASVDRLDEYADMMFGPDVTMRPAGMLTTPPCAMLEVTTLTQDPIAPAMQQATL